MVNLKSFIQTKEGFTKAAIAVTVGLLVAAIGGVQISRALTGGGYGNGTTAPGGVVPIKRFFGGHHFYTTGTGIYSSEANPAGFSFEGNGFNGYAVDSPTPQAAYSVYRAYNPVKNDHLFTINYTEYLNSVNFGYKLEGVSFFEYNSLNDPTTTVFVNPVYRAVAPSTGDHFYTLNPTEYDSATNLGGYKAEGIAFYAPQ